MARRRSSAGYIFFIIFMVIIVPIIILSIVFFTELNDYNMNEEIASDLEFAADDLEMNANDIERFIQMPTGETVAIVSDFGGESRYVLNEINTETAEFESSYPLVDSLYDYFFVTYQNDGIILSYITENYALELYSYETGSAPVKLQYEPIYVDTSAYTRSSTFDNGMYFVGQSEAGDYVALTVKDGNISTTNLSQMPELQNLNITRVWGYDFLGYDLNYPVVEISTYENESYYYDMYHPVTGIQYFESDPFWDVETALISNFAAPETFLEDAEDSLHAINLFYPELFYLDTESVLILGRSSVNDSSPVSGVITDITGENLIRTIPQAEFFEKYEDTSNVSFLVQEVNQTIYASHDDSSGMVNGSTSGYTFAEYEEATINRAENMRVEAANLLEEGDDLSWDKAVHFVQNNVAGQVGIINIAAYIAFPIVAILIIAIVGRRRRNKSQRNIKDAYANNGEVVLATLVSIQQTGMYINEQPQVDMDFKFWFRGRELTRPFRTLINLIDPPRVGDQAQLLYDPVKDKLFDPNPGE